MKLHLLITIAICTLLLRGQVLLSQEQQAGTVTIEQTGSYTVGSLLEKIRSTNFISYENRIIPFNATIELQKGTYTLAGILTKICQPNRLRFSIEQGKIYINRRNTKTAKTTAVQYFTLSGTILDQANGEAVIGSSISIVNQGGIVSNGYGFYSITLPAGEYVMNISHTGYQPRSEIVSLERNLSLNINLSERVNSLNEIVVQGRQPQENINGVIPGVNNLNFRNGGEIPYFLGEVDVLQGSLLLPGISNLGEDSNGINIRGGSPSQNLILLDEAVIFNASHLYGLISIFNPESVNDAEIFKGSIPARYGGRNASVINIRQREGNNKDFNVAGGIGLVASRLTVEGPLIKDKASFLVSARRSLVNLSGLTTLDPSRANFLDLNFKLSLKANQKNKFYLSGYFGDDRSNNRLDLSRKWGNRTLTLRWNHIFNEKLFSNTSLIFSEYTYRVTNEREAGSFQGTSKILNYDAKFDYSYYLSNNQLINFGGGLNAVISNPGDRLPLPESGATIPIQLDTELALIPYLYLEREGKIGKFNFNLGARFSTFLNIGPEDVLVYGSDDRSLENVTDTISYDAGEVSQRYFSFEPRAFLSYTINKNSSLKYSYSRNYQFLHLISNTLSPSPTDIWKISDNYIEPTISDQISLGFYKNLKNNEFETSVEAYYRRSQNVVEYRDNADLVLNENIETEVLSGIGRAYGLELFIKKNSGRLTGWISYTLSKSETRVSNDNPILNINSGEYFPNNFDQTHQFSTTGIYNISTRLSLSANFIFATGKPTTLPAAKYELGGIVVP
ncbi:MAG: TonB-dependent receptor, partial [Bacteroidota bacterium]